jgi:hypothetical protein
MIFTYPRCYPTDLSANHHGERESERTARRQRGDQNLILFVYCTMGLFFSQPDRTMFGVDFLLILHGNKTIVL